MRVKCPNCGRKHPSNVFVACACGTSFPPAGATMLEAAGPDENGMYVVQLPKEDREL